MSFSYPVEGLEAAPLEAKDDKSEVSSANELKSSVESVNIEDVLLWLDDKNAEAARRSSSKSETVNKELPIDLVTSEAVDNCTDNQSSEQNPDSNEPEIETKITWNRFHGKIWVMPTNLFVSSKTYLTNWKSLMKLSTMPMMMIIRNRLE